MKHNLNLARRMRTRRSGGFTLVEMLLVLSILALLAGIVYPKFIKHTVGARITTAQVQIKAFSTALDVFAVDNGYFPKGRDGLLTLLQRPHDAQNWHGPYLDEIPKDPWGMDYVYECPGKQRPDSYDLISAGPDGKFGTADDVSNGRATAPQTAAH